MYPQVYDGALRTLHCSAILDLDFLDATYVNRAIATFIQHITSVLPTAALQTADIGHHTSRDSTLTCGALASLWI